MKKFYSTILTLFAFVTIIHAQTINFDAAGGYHTAAVEASLNDHADWAAQSTAAGKWRTDGSSDQILTTSNWQIMTYQNGLVANVGQTISLTLNVRLGNDGQGFHSSDKQMLFVGLKDADNATGNDDRDGVNIMSSPDNSGEVRLTNISASGAGTFATNPTISQATKNIYEVIIEYTIGATAATSTKSARIRNVSSNETSSVVTATGISTTLYTEITTPAAGGHFYSYALGFYGDGGINRIIYSQLTLNVSSSPLLSVKKNNAFQFAVYPNPVRDHLNIQTKENITSVEVINLLGQSVMKLGSVKEGLNISSLTKGMYMLKLESDKGISTKRIIKQ